jgi:hypothetical protein
MTERERSKVLLITISNNTRRDILVVAYRQPI